MNHGKDWKLLALIFPVSFLVAFIALSFRRDPRRSSFESSKANAVLVAFTACKAGDKKELETIEHSFSLAILKNEHEDNVLICAAKFGRTHLFPYLVQTAGIDINGKNKFGETALIVAARKRQSESVRALLRMDADRTIKDNSGRTALDHVKGMYPEVESILRTRTK